MEILIDIAIAVVTGVALWAFLPRGVVLTRVTRTRDWQDHPLNDTWELRNDSALPIRLQAATVSGVGTYDVAQEKFAEIDLPAIEGGNVLGVALAFDDEVLEIQRTDNQYPWKGLVVPPGDTLQATVTNNTMLRVKYRRAGYCGIFERREVRIHGHA